MNAHPRKTQAAAHKRARGQRRARHLIALALVAGAGMASAQYTNMLRPGMTYSNMAAANADFMLSQMIQQGQWRVMNMSMAAAIQRGSAAGTGGKAAPANPPPAPRSPLTATDFRPTGQRDAAQLLAAAVADAPSRAQLLQALRQIQATIEATPGFRKHNLAAATALLLGASLQVITGREFDDAASEGLLRLVNDGMAETGVVGRLSAAQRTRTYDVMVLTGGLIAGIASNAQETGNAEMAAVARKMAHDALATLGLDDNSLAALVTPRATPSAEASPRWGLWQYATPEGQPRPGQGLQAWQLIQGRSFCQFGLYLAVAGSRDAAADFVAEWGLLGKARGMSAMAPQAARSAAPNGWARVEAERDEQGSSGRYQVRQVTYSGHGRRMSAIVTANDAGLCRARGDAFLASLVPLLPQDADTAAVRRP